MSRGVLARTTAESGSRKFLEEIIRDRLAPPPPTPKPARLAGFGILRVPMSDQTVLIVEDSSYLADSLIDMLQMHGFSTIHAQSGTQGVASAIAHQPDLILLDIRLPDISGYEVFRQLREHEWGKTARILILTASESVENIAKNIDLPSEHVLFKPEWSMQDLLQRIQERLTKE